MVLASIGTAETIGAFFFFFVLIPVIVGVSIFGVIDVRKTKIRAGQAVE